MGEAGFIVRVPLPTVELSLLISCAHTPVRLVRTWVLILGMSGIIVLFWFVSGGSALRYFVSDPSA